MRVTTLVIQAMQFPTFGADMGQSNERPQLHVTSFCEQAIEDELILARQTSLNRLAMFPAVRYSIWLAGYSIHTRL